VSVGVGGGRAGGEVECAFERLVTLADLLLGDVGELDDFAKCPRDSGLSACDEQTGRNDRVRLFAPEQLLLLASAVKHLGCIGDGARERVLVTHGLNLLENDGERPLGFLIGEPGGGPL